MTTPPDKPTTPDPTAQDPAQLKFFAENAEVFCKLYVGNLTLSTDDDIILNHFSKYGKVSNILIKRYEDSGDSRGTCVCVRLAHEHTV
jgi:RNA recognition motif-containing protein